MFDIDKLKKTLEENPDSFRNFMKEKIDFENRCKNKVGKFIKSLNPEDIDKYIDLFFNWEKKYENMKYNQGYITSSNVFNGLISYIESVNENSINLDEDFSDEYFLAEAFSWRNYVFKLYIGQGSSWSVLRDGEIIFSTT
jgi:hypothetical protein